MGRLIDVDKLLEETRRDRDYARKNGFLDMYYERQVLIDRIKAQPTAFDTEKIIEKLEERTSFLSDCTKYGNKDAEQQNKSYSTMMMYEVADLVDDLIEIVKQEAEQYEECYNDCGDCEAYNKEKHHCPKFCKVIKETVKEIEENRNKGKWEMTYKGKRKDVNTGLMISAYNCKCSVCGWETGNQGTRFSYCPNCGAKMDEVNKPKGE